MIIAPIIRAKNATLRAITSLLALITLLALLVAPAAAQGSDPAAVVRAYLDAIVARDADAAIALVADDVTHTDTHAPPGLPSVTRGKADVDAYLKGWLADPGYRLEYANLQASGDTVTWTAKEWLGAENLPPNFPLPIESHYRAVVTNGKIASLLLDNDPAWLEKLYAAIPPEAIDPASVVQLWAKAANAHDLDRMLALFADDATVTQTPPLPGGKSPLNGTADLRALFERDIKANARIELSNFAIPEPDNVTFSSSYWADPGAFPANFPLPIESTNHVVVKDGKIRSLTIEYTPEWLAKLQAAPSALPRTGEGASSPSSGLLVGVGIALLAIGFGVLRPRSA
jgi:ketosteroid isomerase-like protein